ncbi:hypothetical protein [Bradyrhizobium sp. AUGA SZCCT0222]|uniref:hypothetical protein n=1 Tax=Bradyrhizobium sp. AUGA SZCCT0222 TaxID=2807668 RepID=UPI002011DB57|nr:hypothetical protein [Bradyrhizobium sp. AUGA SZCCT0222]
MSMDEIRSTLFTAKLRWLLAQALQRGERVLWQGQPDGVARMMFWRFLWWIGIPWLALVAIALTRGWIAESAMVLLVLGVAMVGTPLLVLLRDLQTLYVITNRRALIVRTFGSKPTVTDTLFSDMDATFEILDIGRGRPCTLFFASGISSRASDTAYTGHYGFHCIRDAVAVRDILERARREDAARSAGTRQGSARG